MDTRSGSHVAVLGFEPLFALLAGEERQGLQNVERALEWYSHRKMIAKRIVAEIELSEERRRRLQRQLDELEQETERVAGAIGELTEFEREIVTRKYLSLPLYSPSNVQVAEAIGCSEATIRRHLPKIHAKLKGLIDRS